MTRHRRQRLALIGLFALFFIPVLGALILRANPDLMGTLVTTNHGTLLEQPRPVVAQGLTPRPPAPPGGATFRDNWSIVLIDDGSCQQACKHALFAMRQAHIAMNKDMDRVHRFLLLPPSTPAPVSDADLSGLVVADASAAWLRTFLPAARGKAPGAVYLVDPRGFLFMVFEPGFEPGHLMKDLKRLLKISRVG